MNRERRIHSLLQKHEGRKEPSRMLEEVYLKLMVDPDVSRDKRIDFIFSDRVLKDPQLSASNFAKIIEAGLLFAGPKGFADFIRRVDVCFEGYKPFNNSNYSDEFKGGCILGLLSFGTYYGEESWPIGDIEKALIETIIFIAIRCGGSCSWPDELKGVLSNAMTAYYEHLTLPKKWTERVKALGNALVAMPKFLKACDGIVSYELGPEEKFTQPVLREIAFAAWRMTHVTPKINMLAGHIKQRLGQGQPSWWL